jgi:hypothetical protein
MGAYIFNPELGKKAMQQQQLSTQKVQAATGSASFQGVLNNMMHHQEAVESAIAAEEKNIRKKKKDSTEMIAEYKEQMTDTYDVLELEKKIRTVFRKIQLDI